MSSTKIQSPPLLAQLPTQARLMWQLTKRDFRGRYTGSMLGALWVFLQPLAFMATLWVVFNYGLRAKAAAEGVPYSAWFFSAMVAWNFWSEAFASSNSVLLEYGFLLRKVKFDAHLLPIVKILSALMVHSIFLGLLFAVLLVGRVQPDWSWLSLPIYTLWGSLFALGLGYLVSAVHVFFRDTGQIIGIILQLGFWGTPIAWDINLIPEQFHRFVKLNPVSYLTEGYRSALLFHQNFWEFNPGQALYAWSLCLGLLGLGIFVFQRLRPHFGDVI